MLKLSAQGPKRRGGRRPGRSGTREAILDAAQRSFASSGYERTTIRAVATEAGVDPALVAHYFGSKQQLFLTVVELPFDAETVLPAILTGERTTVGERFARFIVELLADEQARSVITAMVRAAATEQEAARLLRELISRRVVGPIAESLGAQDAELRATLVGSQVVGVVMARYVVAVEPLASLEQERLVAALAPNLQRYLAGDLG